MFDWNVVVTVAQDRFKTACDVLQPLGPVKATHYYNTVVMKVEEVRSFMETIREWMQIYPDAAESLTRVAPVTRKFEFHSADEFAEKVKQAALEFAPQLAGKGFHVRVHRRGAFAMASPTAVERELGILLCDTLERQKTPAHAEFKHPDAILDVETVDDQAGLALWSSEDLERFPWLKLD